MAQKNQSIGIFGFIVFLVLVNVSNAFNLGLISGDLRRTSAPISIKKTSHHSPVVFNINSYGISKLPTVFPPVLTPKIPKKSLLKSKKNSPKTKLIRLSKLPKLLKSPKLRRITKLPKIPKIPKIPKLPLLPIIPTPLPLLPLIPKIPLLPLIPILPPLPILPLLPPKLPKLSRLLKPIKVPILGRSGLNALGSEVSPVRVPAPNLKRNVLQKLVRLRKNGSLTTPEFIRFKKLLLSK